MYTVGPDKPVYIGRTPACGSAREVARSRIRPFRVSTQLALASGFLVASAGACAEPESTCSPVCESRVCGEDGCGGSCGSCGPDDRCDDTGDCVLERVEPPCDETCASLGFHCGEVCGEVCGSCAPEGEICLGGACECAPACEGRWCTDGDGCGGTCEPCPKDQNCSDCPLQLRVSERSITATGQVTDVTLELSYVSPSPGLLPTMADLRMEVGGPVKLMELEVGEAVSASGKSLQVDPETGEETLVLPDGTLRWAIFSLDDQTPLEEGLWLTMRFRMGAAFEPAQLPGVFTLRDDEVTLTPTAAESALWGSGVTTPVVVWYEAVEETR